MTEVKKPFVIYEDNQGAIFLAKNRQVSIRTKHIHIRCHFLRDMAEEKYIDIQYIHSEDNPAGIMNKKNLEADFARHMRSITEGELWSLWILEGRMSRRQDSRMISSTVTRLNIPITHSLKS